MEVSTERVVLFAWVCISLCLLQHLQESEAVFPVGYSHGERSRSVGTSRSWLFNSWRNSGDRYDELVIQTFGEGRDSRSDGDEQIDLLLPSQRLISSPSSSPSSTPSLPPLPPITSTPSPSAVSPSSPFPTPASASPSPPSFPSPSSSPNPPSLSPTFPPPSTSPSPTPNPFSPPPIPTPSSASPPTRPSPTPSPTLSPITPPSPSSSPVSPPSSPPSSPTLSPASSPSPIVSPPTLPPSQSPSPVVPPPFIPPSPTPSSVVSPPTLAPSPSPSISPILPPSTSPSSSPILPPSPSPSSYPILPPSPSPSIFPPSQSPSTSPSQSPSPSPSPSSSPSPSPSTSPSSSPSLTPSPTPSIPSPPSPLPPPPPMPTTVSILANLTISGAELVPEFDPYVFNYTASFGAKVRRFHVTAYIPKDEEDYELSSLYIENVPLKAGERSPPLKLGKRGENVTYKIFVKETGHDVSTYVLSISREAGHKGLGPVAIVFVVLACIVGTLVLLVLTYGAYVYAHTGRRPQLRDLLSRERGSSLYTPLVATGASDVASRL